MNGACLEIDLTPSPEQVTWMAGLFDGEGHIGAHGPKRKDGNRSIVLALKMTDRDTVVRFAKLAACGSVREELKKNPRHNPTWNWEIVRKEHVERLLRMWLPYLVTKAEKARWALEQLQHIRYTQPVAQCGTHGGYMAHRRKGEDPCWRCKVGQREYMRERRKRMKDKEVNS